MRNFAAFYEENQRKIWALVYSKTKQADLAQDITQEAFFKLFKEKGVRNPVGWLSRVVINLIKDHNKSAFVRNGTRPHAVMELMPTVESSALDRLIETEMVENVRKQIKKLSADDQQIIRLIYFYGWNADKVAKKMSIKTTALHMRVSRARRRLKDLLEAA